LEADTARRFNSALTRAYSDLAKDPGSALDDLLHSVPGLDPNAQRAELNALVAGQAFALEAVAATPRLDREAVERWRAWALQVGLLQPD